MTENIELIVPPMGEADQQIFQQILQQLLAARGVCGCAKCQNLGHPSEVHAVMIEAWELTKTSSRRGPH